MTCRSAQAEPVRVVQSSLDRAMRWGTELRCGLEAERDITLGRVDGFDQDEAADECEE
jgi:hypothetical protein